MFSVYHLEFLSRMTRRSVCSQYRSNQMISGFWSEMYICSKRQYHVRVKSRGWHTRAMGQIESSICLFLSIKLYWQSHAYLFTYYLWLLSPCHGKLNSFDRDPKACRVENIYCLALYGKSLPAPSEECGLWSHTVWIWILALVFTGCGAWSRYSLCLSLLTYKMGIPIAVFF